MKLFLYIKFLTIGLLTISSLLEAQDHPRRMPPRLNIEPLRPELHRRVDRSNQDFCELHSKVQNVGKSKKYYIPKNYDDFENNDSWKNSSIRRSTTYPSHKDHMQKDGPSIPFGPNKFFDIKSVSIKAKKSDVYLYLFSTANYSGKVTVFLCSKGRHCKIHNVENMLKGLKRSLICQSEFHRKEQLNASHDIFSSLNNVTFHTYKLGDAISKKVGEQIKNKDEIKDHSLKDVKTKWRTAYFWKKRFRSRAGTIFDLDHYRDFLESKTTGMINPKNIFTGRYDYSFSSYLEPILKSNSLHFRTISEHFWIEEGIAKDIITEKFNSSLEALNYQKLINDGFKKIVGETYCEKMENEFPDFVSNSCKQGNYIRASKDVIGDKNRLHINFSIKNATGSKYYNFNTEENPPKITLNQERDWDN
tara:strand:+ start:3248 stop:4501 length:1254 start_codon:yes stop_codon:yes gene_type:complete